MNNTNITNIQNIVGKLPVSIFFEQLPDRKQALKYLNWLYTNVPESKNVSQDQLFREVISKELRIVSMKTVEIEILLMVALNTITIDDFTIDSKTLILKLIKENPDNYDLDIMYRIMAQIMTKLPKDLKERVNGKQKLDIFQKIAQHVNIDNNLLEKFMNFDPTMNTPITMDLDSGDYNTLNKKYLTELKQYEDSKGYINSDHLEYSRIAKDMIHTSNTNTSTNTNTNAEYIDSSPDFMLGKNDNTLYYYDSSSGSLSEMPLNSTQKPLSLKDLKTILIGKKIKQTDIQGLIDNLNPVPTVLATDPSLIAQPSNYFDTIGSYFSSVFTNDTTTTTSPNTINNTKTENVVDLAPLPEPPKYIKDTVKTNTNNIVNTPSNLSSINNLEVKFKDRQSTYENFNNYSNNSNTNTNINENILLKKIKNDNQHIENVALGFVSMIIIVLLLVIFNSIRTNSK